MAGSLYVMSPMEIAWGYVFGHDGRLPPARDESISARRALEDVVRDALMRTPCGVAFSGGRDSSTILAVAVHVARRDGLPEPIPITRVFPEAPATEETDWQEMVLRHLRMNEWERVVLRDEIDVLGPLAQANIVEHGVLWPPTVHGDVPMQEIVKGGSLLDGEGGDELLGATYHRVAPLTSVVRRPRPIRRARIRRALGALAPARLRSAQVHRHVENLSFSWLRPQAHAALVDAYSSESRDAPLSFARSARRMMTLRQQTAFERNRSILARRFDVHVASPLQHPEVVHALAREGGLLGLLDRTSALRALVPDLLPDAILTRTTKALFHEPYQGRYTREFVDRWSGEGLEADLVDADELMRIWRSGTPWPLTSALLQAAWLTDRGTAATARKGQST